jgi:hypothetical protein
MGYSRDLVAEIWARLCAPPEYPRPGLIDILSDSPVMAGMTEEKARREWDRWDCIREGTVAPSPEDEELIRLVADFFGQGGWEVSLRSAAGGRDERTLSIEYICVAWDTVADNLVPPDYDTDDTEAEA